MTEPPGAVYLPATAIAERVADLAAAIDRDHRGAPLTLVAVLKGAVVLCADLSRALTIPNRIDTIQLTPFEPRYGVSWMVSMRWGMDTARDRSAHSTTAPFRTATRVSGAARWSRSMAAASSATRSAIAAAGR